MRESLHVALCNTGLHAYNLDIRSITVDGVEARYELRPYVEENLPQNVLEGKPTMANTHSMLSTCTCLAWLHQCTDGMG